jgi:hypothetical protein
MILPSSTSPGGLDAQGFATGWPTMRGSAYGLHGNDDADE